ncbi:radical SAM family heme chaperone HemW [Sessilibacter sp. MAH1]
MTKLALPPLALYVHIPWCVRKCPYCDFNSHAGGNEIPEQEYLTKLLDDLTLERQYTYGRKISSIFFGGGTPSLFTAKTIGTIIEQAERMIGFDEAIEITLEANPGTAEQAKFADFFRAGVNRLSLGIQSFQPEHLIKLGRIHNDTDAQRAIEMAKQAGFTRLNLDLMHGLSGQTVEQALRDIDMAARFEPDHLSWYQLTIEANTEFYSRPPQLPEEDCLADIQEFGLARLQEHGYQQYEISAYAKSPSSRSKHNLNYWQFGDYLAIGAGAHGKITHTEQNTIERYWKTRLPADYLKKDSLLGFTANQKIVSKDELPLEFFMNSLRLVEGVDVSLYQGRTGLELNKLNLTAPINKGLIEIVDRSGVETIKPTDLGLKYLNNTLDYFL